MKHSKTLSIALAVVGLMCGTVLVGWYGFGTIVTAVLSVGAGGFALLCAWQVVVFAILGLAWWTVVPQAGTRWLPPFIWGRMVRDSAACCLPFSQVGGFILGARAASLHGIAWSAATISLVIDLTAEFLSEILFAVAGLLVLLVRTTDVSMTVPIAIGLAISAVLGVAIFRLQTSIAPLFVRFGQLILGDMNKSGALAADGVSHMDMATLYSQTGRCTLVTGVHIVGWFGKGIGNWIAFRLLGADIDLVSALAIEGLLHALLIPAFLVPGYAGVQEAGYASIGLFFGIPPELSIEVSLLRRARDIALGIPILLVWQFVEMRRLRKV